MAIEKFSGKYQFLSNFWPVEILYEGIIYPSLEHAYQAAKTFKYDERIKISKLSTAAAAKKAGRKVTMRDDWDGVKLHTMKELVRLKFMAHSDLGRQLLMTGNVDLIEGNWWGDTYWGVCKGKGDNHLGEILMNWRNHLKELMD